MPNNTNSSDSEIPISTNNQKGFTILELIIAMIVFLIVTGAAYGFLLVTKQSRTTVNQQVQLTKNVRLALNLVGRDTDNAGFDYPLKFSVNLPDNRISTLLGIPSDTGSGLDFIPPIIAGNNINLNTFAVPNTNTDQATFIYKDSTFNVVGTVGPPDTTRSQSLPVGSLTPSGSINQAIIPASAGPSSICSVNDIYVVTGSNGSGLAVATAIVAPAVAGDHFTVKFVANDVLGFNKNGATSPLSTLTPGFTIQIN